MMHRLIERGEIDRDKDPKATSKTKSLGRRHSFQETVSEIGCNTKECYYQIKLLLASVLYITMKRHGGIG